MGTTSTRGAKLLLIDTETTGLERSKGATAIELAAALYSVEHREVLQTVSVVLPTETNEAEHINRISPAITQLDQPWRTGLAFFNEMAAAADYAMAHNAAFDKKWFGHGNLPHLHLEWLCSMELKWGPMPGRSLRDVALAHGMTITPDHHRAMPDVLLLAGVLSRREDLEELIEDATRPRKIYRAIVPFSRKDEAKMAGFKWEAGTKRWLKPLTEDERQGLPFEVVLCG